MRGTRIRGVDGFILSWRAQRSSLALSTLRLLRRPRHEVPLRVGSRNDTPKSQGNPAGMADTPRNIVAPCRDQKADMVLTPRPGRGTVVPGLWDCRCRKSGPARGIPAQVVQTSGPPAKPAWPARRTLHTIGRIREEPLCSPRPCAGIGNTRAHSNSTGNM
jgi:hypothetical protein